MPDAATTRPWWVVLAAWWRNRDCFTIREAWGWFR